MLSRLSHPNVIKYKGLHYSKTRQQYSLLMEFGAHGTLESYLKKHPEGVSDRMLAELMAQLLSGVAYLHSQRIIHRDIKPANLLLVTPTRLAIADFDVATQVVRLRTQLRSCVGTPWYTAPEVIMVEPYSTAADVWSIGCCALHLGTGRRPYSECNHVQAAYKMVNEPQPALPDGHNLSPEAVDFMQQCWQRDPSHRPAAATLLHHALLRKYHLCPTTTPSTPMRAPVPPEERFPPGPVGGLGGDGVTTGTSEARMATAGDPAAGRGGVEAAAVKTAAASTSAADPEHATAAGTPVRSRETTPRPGAQSRI